MNQTVVLPQDLLSRLPAGQNGLAQSWAPDWAEANKLRSGWTDRWAREITN